MRRYAICSVDDGGKVITSTATAVSEQEAIALSNTDPRRLISIRSVFDWDSSVKRTEVLSRTSVVSYYEGVVQMLSSGLTLTEALETIKARETGASSHLARSQLAGLLRGWPPSIAFDRSHEGRQVLLAALTRAGERNGELAQCLARFCRLERSSLALQHKLIAASLYPLGMLGFSGLVMLFLFMVVIPKFSAILEGSGKSLPLPSQIVFGVSSALTEHPMSLLLAAGSLLALALASWRVASFRRLLLQAVMTVPALKRLADDARRARVNRMLAAMVGGGLPICAAMDRVVVGISDAAKAPIEACRSLIASGSRPSAAFLASGLVSDLEAQLMASAERGGNLATMLDRIAEIQEESALKRSESMTALYSPVLMFVVAIIVATVVVSLYWPLLDVFDAVK